MAHTEETNHPVPPKQPDIVNLSDDSNKECKGHS
jgi:hypothetical protein